ncbi:MAG: MotA/TolQ/ExbB proton channel family protein [Verrucomicrobiota bacterium]
MKSIVKWPLIAGSILFIGGPAIGLLGTVLAMVGAFQEISVSESGATDAEALSSEISSALITTLIGIPVGILGIVLLLFSLIAFLVTRNQRSLDEVAVEE